MATLGAISALALPGAIKESHNDTKAKIACEAEYPGQPTKCEQSETDNYFELATGVPLVGAALLMFTVVGNSMFMESNRNTIARSQETLQNLPEEF